MRARATADQSLPRPARLTPYLSLYVCMCYLALYVCMCMSLSRARALSLYARARCARVCGLQRRWAAQQTHEGQVSGMHMRVMSASASSVAHNQRPVLAFMLKSPFFNKVSFTIH